MFPLKARTFGVQYSIWTLGGHCPVLRCNYFSVHACKHIYARDVHPPVHPSASRQHLSWGKHTSKLCTKMAPPMPHEAHIPVLHVRKVPSNSLLQSRHALNTQATPTSMTSEGNSELESLPACIRDLLLIELFFQLYISKSNLCVVRSLFWRARTVTQRGHFVVFLWLVVFFFLLELLQSDKDGERQAKRRLDGLK